MMNTILKLTVMLFTFLTQVNSLQSQTLKAPYVSGQLIVKFKEGKSSKTNHLITQLNANPIKSIPDRQVELWQVDNSNAKVTIEQLAESYKDYPDIEFIEPNYLYTTSDVQVSNDPDFKQQWALQNKGELEGFKDDADIDATEAWEIKSKSPSIVVGILDTGVDWRHPDLINNIWQNSGEDLDSNGVLIKKNGKWIFDPNDVNGIDDDGNGYIDDFIGWNFVDNNNQPFDYEAAEDGGFVQSHGTHVAGIIGASGNNGIGVSGVTQHVQLAVLKFLSDDIIPEGSATNAAEAIDYAVKMNFQISNNSWGGSQYSSLIKESIDVAAANNHLFVTAAGNGGIDKIGDNMDLRSFYPAHYGYYGPNYEYDPSGHFSSHSLYEIDQNNIITVANSNQADELSASSNFGANAVHLAAPGTDIYNCLPFGYGWLSGTSMAAPHVTGACALLWQRGTELYDTVHYGMIKDRVINHTDTVEALQSNILSGGRLNLHQSLLAIENPDFQNLYQNCRQRDSLTLKILNNSLNVRNWDLTQPMDTWTGVKLNSMGCVRNLRLESNAGYIFSDVPIKAEIPAEIGDLSELNGLIIKHTIWPSFNNEATEPDEIVYGRLPAEIGNLQKLKTILVTGQLLKGNLLPELARLNQLNQLDLSDNHLTGNIPLEIMYLPKLRILNLSSNKLEGVIPPEINNLTNLEYVDLSANNLSGTIPNTITQLNLNTLNLANNNLSGNIPNAIGYMPLQFLILNNNNLTGSIPPEFYYLDLDFQYGINISHNQLSGCYDPYVAYLEEWSDKQFGNKNNYPNAYVSDGNGFEANWRDFIETEAGSCWASEVSPIWPGDFNNDGVVNQKDIVFYGFAVESEGPHRERPDTSKVSNVDWAGQLCPEWNNHILGINGKHQDADGNGVVDALDYEVILDNWGFENPDHISNSNDLSFISNGIELVLEEVEGTTNTTYDLFLKRVGNPDTPVYGIAGTIEFSFPISPESEIIFDDSCLASDGTFADFEFNFEKTVIEFGITQTDNVNIVCDKALARIVIVIIEDEAGEGGDKFLTFKVNGITSEANSQSNGDINEAIGASMSQTLQAPSDDNFNIRVEASPQRCRLGGSATAYVSGGILPYQYLWNTGDTTNNITNLVAGDYTLIVSDKKGISDTLTVEIEEQQLFEYDENGELLPCDMILGAGCVENIDFDAYGNIIEQGFYGADKTIYTSGKILKNKEVDLQAGNEVILKPGFTMEPETILNVNIQNCNEE